MRFITLILSLVLVSCTFTVSNLAWITAMIATDDLATSGWVVAAVLQLYVIIQIAAKVYSEFKARKTN